jgi:hypothetical protein
MAQRPVNSARKEDVIIRTPHGRRIPAIGFLLLAAASGLSGCLASDTQYQRPRSDDTPSIYANSSMPVGRLKDN